MCCLKASSSNCWAILVRGPDGAEHDEGEDGDEVCTTRKWASKSGTNDGAKGGVERPAQEPNGLTGTGPLTLMYPEGKELTDLETTGPATDAATQSTGAWPIVATGTDTLWRLGLDPCVQDLTGSPALATPGVKDPGWSPALA